MATDDMMTRTNTPTFITSTGEDHPDEWPLEGWEAARHWAGELTPPANVIGVVAVIALVCAMAWAGFFERSNLGFVAAAPEPAGASKTGSITP